MKIGRSLPPAAAPLSLRDILRGSAAIIQPQKALERFKDEIKHYFNMRYCFLVSSGKAALTLILQSIHELHPDRDEVVIPAFDCFSVPSSIIRAGLKVRLCDINPLTLDFEPESLKRILSKKDGILCIIPTHFFGFPAIVKNLKNELAGSGIMIVEDAAQAMGSIHNGLFLGTQGDAGFFSLSRGKAISAVEGGIIITNNPRLASKLETLVAALGSYGLFGQLKLLISACFLYFFLRPSLFWFPKLLPFVRFGETVFDPDFLICRMSGMQAGLTRSWREKLRTFTIARKEASRTWAGLITKSAHFQRIIPTEFKSASLIRYPVLLKNREVRDKIIRDSNVRGLGITRMYPQSVDTIEFLQFSGEEKKNPGARACADQLITFPNHCLVKKKDIARIKLLFRGL